jgi:hypothetical protein
LGIGDWAQSPIPNPQSPIPNPQSPKKYNFYYNYFNNSYFIINQNLNKKLILNYYLGKEKMVDTE